MFRNIHRKTPVWGLFLMCFPVNIAKFLRVAFFIEHFWVTASDSKRAENEAQES